MSHIRSKNTTLDLAMKQLLRSARIRFRVYPKIFGNPDFLVDDNIAVFCDSSFWHGRNWRRLKAKLEGGSDPSYWVDHISKNRRRDKLVTRTLDKSGYKVARFWDSEILGHQDECIRKLVKLADSRSK